MGKKTTGTARGKKGGEGEHGGFRAQPAEELPGLPEPESDPKDADPNWRPVEIKFAELRLRPPRVPIGSTAVE